MLHLDVADNLDISHCLAYSEVGGPGGKGSWGGGTHIMDTGGKGWGAHVMHGRGEKRRRGAVSGGGGLLGLLGRAERNRY